MIKITAITIVIIIITLIVIIKRMIKLQEKYYKEVISIMNKYSVCVKNNKKGGGLKA